MIKVVAGNNTTLIILYKKYTAAEKNKETIQNFI